MQFTTLFSTALASLSFLAANVVATPVNVKRDVVDPTITSPDASTVWTVGKTETVTWDTSNLPASITNPQGTILLGFLNDTTGNEHLDVDNPLASGFNITLGSVNVVVPNVADGSDYIIALLGDSGNISPKFTITGGSSSSSSAASSASASASPTASTSASASTLGGSGIVIAGGGSSSTSSITTSTSITLASTSSPSAVSPATSTASGSAPFLTSAAPTISGSISGSGSGSSTSAGSAGSATTTANTSGAMGRFASTKSTTTLMAQLGGVLVAVALFV